VPEFVDEVECLIEADAVMFGEVFDLGIVVPAT